MKPGAFFYRQTTIDQIYHLRLAMLRPGHPALHFPADDGVPPQTWHFGAFQPGGPCSLKNVACLTLLSAKLDGQDAIQLRGMAVGAEFRGRGIGRQLLEVAAQTLRKDERVNQLLWWCNARVEAVPFYERCGWEVVSEGFMIEGVGPHRKMKRRESPPQNRGNGSL